MENGLLERIKDEASVYGKALGNVAKLRLIGAVSRVLGLFLMIFTIVLCSLALLTFIAVAATDAMAQYMPLWAAALIISCAYILIIAVAVLCRRRLFIHPFIALLTKQLIGTQEQLDIETLKAEHEVEMQSVKLETRIDNATRELNFYTGLLSRVWGWIAGRMRK